MRIRREQTAAVVIDIQERLFPHIYEHEALAANSAKLIEGLKQLDIPLLVTQQYSKGLGETIAPVAAALGAHAALEKMTFSCCGDASFMEALQSLGRSKVILCGIEAHVCVQQTALDLLEQGFTPVIVEDCVSSRKANDKHIAVARMRQAGAIVTTLEAVLLELCMAAGTDTFKSISRLIK